MRIPAVVSLLLAVGCARGPNVASELPLKRVVVYRNGVGYFERAGRVDTDEVHFRMRKQMVGDFLATLAIVERGGSTVRSASFPLEIEDEERVGLLERHDVATVSIEANGTPFDAATIRSVVTAAELAELLP